MAQSGPPLSHPGDLARCLSVSQRGRRTTRALLMEEPTHPSDLTRPMLDAIDLFEELGIDYALVGGLAAMYYGRARFTEDVDFIAGPDHEATLAANGEAMKRHHFDPSCTWKLYHDSGIEIDMWRDHFVNDMVARATGVTLADRSVRIVDVHDLVAMKLRAQRPQDDYDISEILKRGQVNEQTVRERVTTTEYEHFQSIRRRVGH